MKTKKLFSSLLVLAFAFSFLLTGCAPTTTDTDTADDGTTVVDDGGEATNGENTPEDSN